MGESPLIFAWPISSRHGWGIRGLGVALNYDGTAIGALSDLSAELPPDDPRWPLLRERCGQSRNFQHEILAKAADGIVEIDAPVLMALGNDFHAAPAAYGRWLRGRPHIACPVFEDVESVEQNIEQLRRYDRVVVASRWNLEVLESHGIRAVLCHEGIDPNVFNPSVRKPRNDGRFRVFSGGKIEHRKGQDLVLQAFKIFAETHDNAVLVAAWSSPFASGADFEGKWEHGAPPGLHIGRPNFHAWAQRAGIRPHQFELVPMLANWQMAEVYGSCDVALFPNRREGGTNFVAMECMACGVPTFIRLGFGQDDLIGTGEAMNCSQPDDGVIEWMAEWLDDAYEDRPRAWAGGSYWTWARHCAELKEIVASV